MGIDSSIRCHKAFKLLVDSVRADYLAKGRRPPSITKITLIISKQIKKDDIIYNGFIKL